MQSETLCSGECLQDNNCVAYNKIMIASTGLINCEIIDNIMMKTTDFNSSFVTFQVGIH